MSRLPVRWRLTVGFAALMACLLAGTGVFVHRRLAADLDRSIDRALRARSTDVAALAKQSESGLREADPGSGPGIAQLIDASGRVIDHASGRDALPLVGPGGLAAVRGGRTVVTTATAGDDDPVRLLARATSAQGQRLVIVVGESLEARDRALADLTGVLALGGPLALVLASLAGYGLTGAALRPVEAMRRRSEEITRNGLVGRLAEPAAQDELGRLGRTLNHMLAELQASVARERAFVADASHELRTPLAMLRTELELVARDRPTGPALDSAVSSAVEETERLTRIADDLLLLSRSDERELAVRVSLTPAQTLLGDAAARARRGHPRSEVLIDVDAPGDLLVAGDHVRLVQALDNLVANALRYARGRIELRARADADWVELHVADDGPGFPPDFLPRAWERFARAEAGRTEEGTGLGLAIVRTIAELHGGSADACNLPGGGADVWLSLPTAREEDGHRGEARRTPAG